MKKVLSLLSICILLSSIKVYANTNLTLDCNSERDWKESQPQKITSKSLTAYGGCKNGTGYVQSNIAINQKGQIYYGMPHNSLDKNGNPVREIFAGGSFYFYVAYINEASWSYTSSRPSCPWIDTYDLQQHCTPICTGSGKNLSYAIYCENLCDLKVPRQSPECTTDEEANKLITDKVTQLYSAPSANSGSLTLPNYDKKEGTADSLAIGKWYKTINKSSPWWDIDYSGDMGDGSKHNMTFLSYNLNDAYIEKRTGKIFYGDYSSDSKYLYQGSFYFTPMDYPDNKNFTIKSQMTDLSAISSMHWSINYSCSMKVKQRFYDLENGGFLFTYRQIDIYDPFPNVERDKALNWQAWYDKNNENTEYSNKHKIEKTYSETEYQIDLTNDTIDNIQKYNAQNNSSDGYLNMNDISVIGKADSNFVKEYFKKVGKEYSPLGELDVGEGDN